MSGVFVCIVGPSGAGKDTLIDAARRQLAQDERFSFPRRIVTRESSSAEDHETISTEAFQAQEALGGFALSWSAHGLGYGIPGSVLPELRDGRVVVCNLSRGAVGDARKHFAAVRVVLVTAPKDALRERLLARGRESAKEVDARLDREAARAQIGIDLTIDNVGAIDSKVAALVEFLRQLAAPAASRQTLAS